jgi:hypothetical protein
MLLPELLLPELLMRQQPEQERHWMVPRRLQELLVQLDLNWCILQ